MAFHLTCYTDFSRSLFIKIRAAMVTIAAAVTGEVDLQFQRAFLR